MQSKTGGNRGAPDPARFYGRRNCSEDTLNFSAALRCPELSGCFCAAARNFPRGGILTAGGDQDYTRYSCCMDAERGVYFFRTYGNARLRACNLRTDGESLEQKEIGGGEDVLIVD